MRKYMIGSIILGSIILVLVACTPGPTTPAPTIDCSNPSAGQNFQSLNNKPVFPGNSAFSTKDLQGQGTLNIDNGTIYDSVAKLVDLSNKNLSYEVYIYAGKNYTINSISDGTYELLFSLGVDWNSKKNAFQACQTYAKFDDSFAYDPNYVTNWMVTLNAVPGGNASSSTIDESKFANP